MRKTSVAILCSIVFGLLTTAAFAGSPQIYKWVDSKGVVHYSDKAPATPQQDVKLISLAPLPAVDAQTVAQNQAWIAGIQQWYQGIVTLENEQQYNQILAWQNQAAENGSVAQQNQTDTSLVYAGYNPYQFHHHHYHPHQGKRPGHFSSPPLVFQPDLWNTRPNAFSQQLFNTNPNIH